MLIASKREEMRIWPVPALFILNLWTSKAALEEARHHLIASQAELKNSETTGRVAFLVYLVRLPQES